MGYLYLTGAIVMELVGTTFLKYSDGFSKLIPAITCITSYIICFFLLSKSLQNLSLSVAYATWSGVGIIAALILSALIFKEGINGLGVLGIILIVSGVVILNLFGKA